MEIDVSLASPKEVLPLRELYKEEVGCQVVLYSWLGRGWANAYLLRLGGRVAGYGCVGGIYGKAKDTIVEFHVLPAHRGAALPLFRRLVAVSQATKVETQTNDALLTLMLYDCGSGVEAEAVLFRDAFTTHLTVPGATFREATEAERGEVGDGDWVVEAGGEVVAAGGVLCHYNAPYCDVHMAVSERHRRRGYGGYLVQELKRTAYEMGKVPAARCSPSNPASRATLQRAGLLPCARVLTGTIAG
jgi:GNAT superfamily N-acetyltransferase